MSDEAGKIILGDTVISSIETPPQRRRRFFGKRKAERQPLTNCENCGAELYGRWCAKCGQAAIDYRRSFRYVIVDVLDAFLSWDSKFFATTGWLITRPWHLTNEFLAGRRVRYLHPLRLYLLASVLFFFAVTHWAKSIHWDASKLSPKERAEIASELQNEADLPPAARDKIRKALTLKSPASESAKTDEPPEQKTASQRSSPLPPSAPSTAGSEKPENVTTESDKQTERDYGPFLKLGPEKPSTPFEQWLETQAKEKLGEHGSKAQLFFITLINNLPYMVLCCIPLFAFVLKILYIRRHTHYIDHLIYALHIHTFAYVGIILIVLVTIGLGRVAPGPLAGWIVGLLWFAFGVQIFLSIRRVYRQGWFFSIFKFFVGGFIYLIVLCMALVATFLATLRWS